MRRERLGRPVFETKAEQWTPLPLGQSGRSADGETAIVGRHELTDRLGDQT